MIVKHLYLPANLVRFLRSASDNNVTRVLLLFHGWTFLSKTHRIYSEGGRSSSLPSIAGTALHRAIGDVSDSLRNARN